MESDSRIDALLSHKGTDNDIASLVHEIEPGRYKYLGNKEWSMFNLHKNEWMPDEKGNQVWNDVQLWFGQKLLQRALYWKTLADTNTGDKIKRYEYSRYSDILMKIVHQLQKPSYQKHLLGELKIYYVVNQ
jgi:hypothetical protein